MRNAGARTLMKFWINFSPKIVIFQIVKMQISLFDVKLENLEKSNADPSEEVVLTAPLESSVKKRS